MYDKNGEKSHEIVINLIFKTANYMKQTKRLKIKKWKKSQRKNEKHTEIERVKRDTKA